MTTKEKRIFISDLIESVRNDLMNDVPKMPIDWDGHELRKLIADRFEWQVSDLMKSGQRLGEYRRALRERNL